MLIIFVAYSERCIITVPNRNIFFINIYLLIIIVSFNFEAINILNLFISPFNIRQQR